MERWGALPAMRAMTISATAHSTERRRSLDDARELPDACLDSCRSAVPRKPDGLSGRAPRTSRLPSGGHRWRRSSI
ncbi:hypothetical protein LRS74_09780 [Streptomyces sp. LX-29]|uniref:hypothetical protein n=1 Tax=Streptomyces sp. LX-29 TaxID=2900152 RepID=UPI00240E83A8|nr:hypothetical protein [Streptomyces sp. LX-29]WFB07305.1 hypothetical protein LRS74_09780 [Streptomyces sp. LX-29]